MVFAMLRDQHKREALALLILRLGLAWFLLVWGITKFLAPVHFGKLYAYFHGLDLDRLVVFAMGAAQIAIAVAMILGLWRVVTYALGWLIHSVTIAVISGNLIAPFLIRDGFPANRNQTVALAAWCGFAAFYLLRDRDLWSLDIWWRRRRGATPPA